MNIAHYLLQVNLYLVAFYILYALLLAKETYFLTNRIYLVSAGFLSLIIPCIRLDLFAKEEIHQQLYLNIDQLLMQGMFVPELEQHFNWGLLLVALYVFGVVFFAIKLIFKLLHLKRLFKVGSTGQAYSFLNKKIVSDSLPEQDTINQHENVHVKQLHTLDVLFFELLGIINWFNPVSYLFKNAVKNIHEYLADEQASALQKDKETYALLLLSHALKVSPNTLTNSFFNKAMLKKRVYMLNRKRSKKLAVLKYGLFVPLFGVALILSSSTISKNKQILSISNQIPLNDLADIKNALNAPISIAESITDEIKKSQNQEPKTQKNMKSTLKLAVLALAGITAQHSLAQTSDTLKITNKEVKSKDSSYIIDGLKGKATNIQIRIKGDTSKVREINSNSSPIFVINGVLSAKAEFEKIKSSDIELITVLKDKSAIDLYGDKGKYGAVLIITKSAAPGNAKAKQIAEFYQKTKPNDLSRDSIPNGVFEFVSIEKQPEFPDGIKAFYEFVGNNLKYPEVDRKNRIQGKVFLSFIVEKDGDLTNIKVTRGLSKETSEEAIRVLSISPKWKPGIQFGVPVRVRYNINVNFSLDK